MTKIAVAFAMSVGLSPIVSAGTAQEPYTPQQLFRNYALSSCIADAYESEDVAFDASTAAAGYLERGEGPLEAYTEATELGRKFLAREYRGHRETSYNMMKCIDLYHSAELDQLVRKYFGPKPE